MTNEVVAKIISVNPVDGADGYLVKFWVGQELSNKPTLTEAFALLSNLDQLQRTFYSMLVIWEEEELVMEPDENLSECLMVYDEHEDSTNLERPLDKYWKVGQISESIINQLVNANLFGIWRTSPKKSESTISFSPEKPGAE